MPATILKKRHWHRCFMVNFAKFFRTTLAAASEGIINGRNVDVDGQMDSKSHKSFNFFRILRKALWDMFLGDNSVNQMF